MENPALSAASKGHDMPKLNMVLLIYLAVGFSDLSQFTYSTWLMKLDKVIMSVILREQQRFMKKREKQRKIYSPCKERNNNFSVQTRGLHIIAMEQSSY